MACLLCEGQTERAALLAEAAPLTDAHTPGTRRKAAASVLSRLELGRRREVRPAGLHHLLAAVGEPAGRQLLTYVVARREPMLAGLATGVLHPYFVDRRVPEGLTAEEFSAVNANGLIEVAGAVTHAAVAEYAQRRWHIADLSPTRRALRLLRKGGILGSAWMARSAGRCLGYFPVLGVPDIACFAYALYSTAREADYVRIDRLRAGLFVKLFMLRPIAVDFLLDQALRMGLIDDARSEIARLPFDSLEAAVGAIVHAHRVGR